jgi:hypothetical protein
MASSEACNGNFDQRRYLAMAKTMAIATSSGPIHLK